VSFGSEGDIFFVSLEQKTSFLTRIKQDATGRQRVSDVAPILNRGGLSPDGEWAVLFAPGSGKDAAPETIAVPVHGGMPRRICSGICLARWSYDGRFFLVSTDNSASPSATGLTLIIPVPAGRTLPDLPASGLSTGKSDLQIPGVRAIDRPYAVVGPDPSTFAFVKSEFRRNLYRIPLH
jgi:hypothetical protein